EIADALAASPYCDEVVVAGTHHDKWGNAVTAFIVGPPGVTPEETLAKVARFAREEAGLPSLKQPKRFVVVEQIPKSAVGKVLRRQLSAGNFTVLADSDEGISR
ncbi:MAG: acyl--CoA ligase, partial [Mycolicibacterium sp.]|nr:acyl--CoA ligase [Mycolicibacterium sp.]